MITSLLGRNYEKVSGDKGQSPEVFVKKSVLEFLGTPLINEESLGHWVFDQLQIKGDIKILLGGNPKKADTPKKVGLYIAGTRAVYVDAIYGEIAAGAYDFPYSTMGILAHELKHLADFQQQKPIYALRGAELGGLLGGLSFAACGLVQQVFSQEHIGGSILREVGANSVANLGITAAAASISTVLAHKQYYRHVDPLEKRARESQHDLVVALHETDILFPEGKSRRTQALLSDGVLNNETLLLPDMPKPAHCLG